MDIKKMMQEVQKLQKTIEKFETQEFDFDYKGYVKIKLTGGCTILTLEINPCLIDPEDPETLQDIITMAINDAKKYVDTEKSKLESKIPSPARGFF